MEDVTYQQIDFKGVDGDRKLTLFCRGDVDELSLEAVRRAFEAPDTGALMLRTVPYEFPLCCDPITLDLNSATFDGLAVDSMLLKRLGGLDRKLGEAAATDLVWRLRAAGFFVRYLPHARVRLAKRTTISHSQKIVESLFMRCKHGSFADIWRCFMLPHVKKIPFGDIMWAILSALLICAARIFRKNTCKPFVEFYGVDYARARGDFISRPPKGAPKVSIIVRSYRRPDVLRETLKSLRHQTYKNFEVVVVDDSEPVSEAVVREFPDLDIVYRALGENRGRAVAANAGFDAASGAYINLLDDDDFLMPEHLEIAVAELEASGCDFVFLQAVALESDETPLNFAGAGKRLMDFPRIDAFTMVRQCVTASNGVLFKRSLLEKVGGMRPDLQAHEDWSLWLRLMTAGSWRRIPYATCYFRVPANAQKDAERRQRYAPYDALLLEDDTLQYHVSAQELRGFYENTIHDFAFLKTLDLMDSYLDEEYRRITSKSQNPAD